MIRTHVVPLALAAACALAACAPQTATPPLATPSASAVPSSAPSVAASAAPSIAPSDAPSAAPSASGAPSQAPSAAPSAALLDMTKGQLLKRYDFEGISNLYYDFSRDQIAVIDGVDEDATPRRYLLRRFKRDGTFEAKIDLQVAGEKAPEAVDGVTFDDRGTLYFTYLEDEGFKLRQLYTAAIDEATRLPTREVERAGLAALGADQDVITLGVVRLDPDALETDTKQRDIFYTRAAEDEAPEAIFRIPDPFNPVVAMRVGTGGVLHMMGPLPGGGFGIKRLDKDQKLTDVPIALTALPDHMWLGPDGDIWLADDTTGNVAATIRRFGPDGTPKGESAITLKDGAKVYDLDGLTFDAQRRPILAGKAITADLQTYIGLFTFD